MTSSSRSGTFDSSQVWRGAVVPAPWQKDGQYDTAGPEELSDHQILLPQCEFLYAHEHGDCARPIEGDISRVIVWVFLVGMCESVSIKFGTLRGLEVVREEL